MVISHLMLTSFTNLYQNIIQTLWGILWKIGILGIIFITTWIITRLFSNFIIKSLGRISKSIANKIRLLGSWLIWLIGILVGLDQLGIDLTILLIIIIFGGGIIVIAFRDVFKNIASHEAITVYTPYKIGDWIQIGKLFGRVVDITLIDTILITPDNETVRIPNSEISKKIIINRTTVGGTRISVPLIVSRKLDLSEVEIILSGISLELGDELIPGTNPEIYITDINKDSVKLTFHLKINNPAKDRFIASEVMKRFIKKLDELERISS